jgi:hypothetical protein
MRSQSELRRRSVFINVPFDHAYEPLFVALISSLVAVGRTPRSVIEVPDQGEGRLKRLLGLIRSCSVSVHDLSRVNTPVRFNMPFELGIAFTLARIERRHKFAVFESQRHRLQRTLSDLNGIDPGIHGGTARGVISCILASLAKPSANPDLTEVRQIHDQLWRAVPALKSKHGRTTIYSKIIFYDLVSAAVVLTTKAGLLK